MGSGFHHRSYRLLLENQGNSAPPSSPTREANFDTNMVIILAALLCALICALGLNSIVRCALRCSRRLAFDGDGGGGPNEPRHATRLAGKGLKKRALKQIPVAAYDSSLNIKSSDCLICLGEFIDGEKIRVLPKCRHGFHVKCIDTWLLSHSSCPTCRQSLLEQPGSGGDADVAVVVVEGNPQQRGNTPAAGPQVNVQISSDQVG